jgi:WD40 repeat protein
MPRGERPLDAGDSALIRFAADLRRLRRKAASPTYRELARRTHYSIAPLSEAASGRKLPTLAVTLAYVDACAGDVAEWERRWHEVAAELAATQVWPGEGDRDAADRRAPYIGLAAFQTTDADLFFGRERLIADLVARLNRQSFLAVFGASGAGKSSLLRAGLIPRWPDRVVLFTPGSHPLEECAVAFASLTGRTPGALRAELLGERRGLHRIVRQAMDGQPGELLVVVDQFEEAFTLCPDPVERAAFIDALITATQAQTSRCRVVLGIRADFYAHCTSYPELVAVLNDAQVAVGPMTIEELRGAIAEPAVRDGYTLEAALLATLVTEAYGQVGVLPLLSHALLETWRRRRGNTLTLAGFQAAGGIQGALAHTAESLYADLRAPQQRLVKNLFLRLIALGESTEDTKRRIWRGELDGLPDSDLVLDRLVQARLLTLDRDSVEITHEALIRCWPRLCDWLAEDRDGLRIHRQLTEATKEWEALGRDPGAIYRGNHLAVAHDWSSTGDRGLSTPEQEFLDAGLAAQAAEQDASRRHARRLRQLVALLSVLSVLAITATGFAIRARQSAAHQRDIATSQRVAERAAALRRTSPALAAQLSLAAYRLAPTTEARSGLLSTFAVPYTTDLTSPDEVGAVAFSPDGRTVATAGRDQAVRLFQIADRHHPRFLGGLAGGTGVVRAMAFCLGGATLFTAGEDGTVREWDTSDRSAARPLSVLSGPTGHVASVACSPAGVLATAGGDGTVRLWAAADPSRRRPSAILTGYPAAISAMAFSRDGQAMACVDADGTVWLRNVTGPVLARLGTNVRAVAFSPDGRSLATAGDDHLVRLWEVADPRHPREVAALAGHTDTVRTVAYSPDGRTLVSAGADATVRLWEVADPDHRGEVATLTGHTAGVNSLAFSPDGHTLATGASDHTTRLWDIPGPWLVGHSSSIYSVAFSPDRRIVATGSYDRTVRLWDASDPANPRELASLHGHTRPVNSVGFSPDGRTLASASNDGTVRWWDISEGRAPSELATPTVHPHSVEALAFSPDGRTLATASDDGTARLWDLSDRRQPALSSTLAGQGSSAEAVTFRPDGRVLAVGGADRTVRLWDVTDRRSPVPLETLTGYADTIKSVAFRPDGNTLATAGEDGVVQLWDVKDLHAPHRLATLTGYTDGVKSVAFSPDGRTLATASSDRTLRLWAVADPRHPTELASLTGHGKPVDSVAFSPDGHTLVSGSEDWTAILWDIDPERVAERICAIAYPAIGQASWNDYFPGLSYKPPCPVG